MCIYFHLTHLKVIRSLLLIIQPLFSIASHSVFLKFTSFALSHTPAISKKCLGPLAPYVNLPIPGLFCIDLAFQRFIIKYGHSFFFPEMPQTFHVHWKWNGFLLPCGLHEYLNHYFKKVIFTYLLPQNKYLVSNYFNSE